MSYQWRHKIKWVKLCVGCITSNVSNNVYFNLTTMKKDWYFSAVIPSLFPKVWTKLTLIAFPSLLVLARNMKCHYYVKRSFRWHHCLRIRITGTFIKDYENVAQFFFFFNIRVHYQYIQRVNSDRKVKPNIFNWLICSWEKKKCKRDHSNSFHLNGPSIPRLQTGQILMNGGT